MCELQFSYTRGQNRSEIICEELANLDLDGIIRNLSDARDADPVC